MFIHTRMKSYNICRWHWLRKMAPNVAKKCLTGIIVNFVLKEESRKYVESQAESDVELIQRVKWDYERSDTISDFLPPMIPISPHLFLFVIFSLFSLIPSPLVFLLPLILTSLTFVPLISVPFYPLLCLVCFLTSTLMSNPFFMLFLFTCFTSFFLFTFSSLSLSLPPPVCISVSRILGLFTHSLPLLQQRYTNPLLSLITV